MLAQYRHEQEDGAMHRCTARPPRLRENHYGGTLRGFVAHVMHGCWVLQVVCVQSQQRVFCTAYYHFSSRRPTFGIPS